MDTSKISDSEQAAQLMSLQGTLPVSDIDNKIPNEPGLYCLRTKSINALPNPYAQALYEREHNIIYIGIASKSLNKRLSQELRAKGHGTFFRSMGAMLGFRPPVGSLRNKKNKQNYEFAPIDESRIIDWMNQHLTVRFITNRGPLAALESQLIKQHLPLLNLQGNPEKLSILEDARRACCEIACR